MKCDDLLLLFGVILALCATMVAALLQSSARRLRVFWVTLDELRSTERLLARCLVDMDANGNDRNLVSEVRNHIERSLSP